MTAQEMVTKLNAELITRAPQGITGSFGWDTVEKSPTQGLPLVALLRNKRGTHRVAGVMAYVNRAQQPQFDIFLEDFEDQDAAETRYLEVLERDGFLAFGSLFRLSRGSGLRFVQDYS